MNSRTELFAVVLSSTITLADGTIHTCSADMYELHREEKDAIRVAENHGKYLLTVDNVYGQPDTGKRYEYESTTDGRYDAEEMEIPQSEWKRITAANCEWDIFYSITFKERGGTRTIHAVKWVDFEF